MCLIFFPTINQTQSVERTCTSEQHEQYTTFVYTNKQIYKNCESKNNLEYVIMFNRRSNNEPPGTASKLSQYNFLQRPAMYVPMK